MFKTLTLLAAFMGCSTILSAQAANPDTFKVTYFSNANTAGAPDATVQVTNVGTDNAQNLCAFFFVFDRNQEISECCVCPVSANGLLTLSVNENLTSNPLTGKVLKEGTIQIVSFACTGLIAPGVRAWSTHIQKGNFAVTETPFSDAGLSAGQFTSLSNKCNGIVLDGSGSGICYCPAE
jgi:hypothetical protein